MQRAEMGLGKDDSVSHTIDYQLSSLWTEATQLITDLGTDGGLMSGSIYDTAQILRYFPPKNSRGAIDWLLAQQERDGAWASPCAPRARYMPTIAVLMALQMTHESRGPVRAAIDAALSFLDRSQQHDWAVLGDDIPGGAELILPRLIDEAVEMGLPVERKSYQELYQLGDRRREVIRRLPRLAGTTATHVWEGWGSTPDLQLVDGSNTIGHSPAASAMWWSKAAALPSHENVRRQVAEGLLSAWRATTAGIEGVICSCWPITHFERAFALYPFMLAGCLLPAGAARCPQGFRQALDVQLDKLEMAMSRAGLGFSDWFLPDGDDTAVAIAVLAESGRAVNSRVIDEFVSDSGDHFCAWRGELQPSPTVTAHAIHALTIVDRDRSVRRYGEYLLHRRLPTGVWPGDKWNISSIYTTAQILIALIAARMSSLVHGICSALAQAQNPDGGWGHGGSSAEETAYAILALLAAKRSNLLPFNIVANLIRARDWMHNHYQSNWGNGIALWLGKETYRPQRISRAFELAGFIAILQEVDL